jgi:glycosyltransferase involved in cell wall biosynthesis
LSNSENTRNYFSIENQENNSSNGFKLCQTKSIPNFFILKKFRLERMAGILNSLFFIPDINIAWLPFAIKKGMQIIDKEKPEIIYSSSPREGVHLIAYILKKKSGLPWVADFRDLWTLYEGRYNPLTFIHNTINTYIEKKIYCQWSDIVIANTSENRKIMSKYFKVDSNKISVITNGYDHDDAIINKKEIKKNRHFKIGFIGGIEKPALCYDEFLKAYASAVKKEKNFKLMIWAKKSDRLIRLIKKYSGVIDNVEFKPYVPHQQCLSELQQVDVLLVLLAKNYPYVVPQKLYNYLGLRKPIFGIVPDFSRVAKIIRECKCGTIVSPDNINSITDKMLELNTKWQNGKLNIEPHLKSLMKYRRDILTSKLATIFDFLLNKNYKFNK